jgi:hypothetical protein
LYYTKPPRHDVLNEAPRQKSEKDPFSKEGVGFALKLQRLK